MDKDLEQMRKDARCLAADGVADQNDVEHVENLISQYYVGACKTLVSSRKWFFNYKSHDEMTERYDQWENLFVQLARERPHVLKTSLWTAIERLYNKLKFPLSNVKNDGFAMKQLLINLVHKTQVCTNGVRQPSVIKRMLAAIAANPVLPNSAAADSQTSATEPALAHVPRRRISMKTSPLPLASQSVERATPQPSSGLQEATSGPTQAEKNELKTMWRDLHRSTARPEPASPLPLADRLFPLDEQKEPSTARPEEPPSLQSEKLPVSFERARSKVSGCYAELMQALTAKKTPVKLEPLLRSDASSSCLGESQQIPLAGGLPSVARMHAAALWSSLACKASTVAVIEEEKSAFPAVDAVSDAAASPCQLSDAAHASLACNASAAAIIEEKKSICPSVDAAAEIRRRTEEFRRSSAAEILASYGASHLDKDEPPVPAAAAELLKELLEAPTHRAKGKRSPSKAPSALETRAAKSPKLTRASQPAAQAASGADVAANADAVERSATEDLIVAPAKWKVGGGKDKSYLQVFLDGKFKCAVNCQGCSAHRAVVDKLKLKAESFDNVSFQDARAQLLLLRDMLVAELA